MGGIGSDGRWLDGDFACGVDHWQTCHRWIGFLWFDVGGVTCGSVCAGSDQPLDISESGSRGNRLLFLGNGQDSLDRGNVVCCAKADYGAELAGNAGGLGGDDEGVLAGTGL